MTPAAVTGPGPVDARLAVRSRGLLAQFNAAGMLDAADVHVAARLGRLTRESDERVLLAVALAVRAVRAGSVCVELAEAERNGTLGADAYAGASSRYGITWLGE